MSRNNKKFKWFLDFNTNKNTDLASPSAFNPSVPQVNSEVVRDHHLMIKKSWDIALGPIKQLPMNLLIMYMAGNSISIFPIMMVGMMLIRPIKAMFSTSTTSKLAESSQGSGQKLTYIVGNIANIALALYKCQSMGLLPIHSSDWLAFVEPQTPVEYFGGGIALT